MIRFRPMPILTLCSLLTLGVLIAFGQWQWGRYQDKRVALASNPAPISIEILQPLPEATQYVYAALEGRGGWRVFAPVRTASDGVVFIDAGFVPGLAPPNTPPPARFASGDRVSGQAIRPRPPALFANPPDPAARTWYAIDLPAMATTAGIEHPADYYLAAPYGDSGSNPFTPAADPLPPERHLGYAITWWGLAAALTGVYLAVHVRAGRLGRRIPKA